MQNITLPQIEEYYIGYFDILGYKEIMLRDDSEKFLETVHLTIQEALDRVVNFNSMLNITLGMEPLVFYKVFSDNIILYYKYDNMYYSNYMLLSFIELVKNIQLNLICKLGVFIRGSITKGEFTANDTYVFGKALIRAVELENKAIYPIIVLDNIIVEDLKIPVTTINQNDKSFFMQLEHALYGIFTDPSPKAFYDRIQKCIYMYLDIIIGASMLPQFKDNTTLVEMQSVYKELSELSRTAFHCLPQQLGMAYDILKRSKDSIIQLAQTVLIERLTQINRYNNDRFRSCVKKFRTSYSFIDYLSVLDTEELVKHFYKDKQEIISILQKNYPEQEEFIASLRNDIEKDHTVTLKEILSIHQKTIEEKLIKYSNNSKVFTKYEWLRIYHNNICVNGLDEYMVDDKCWVEIN